MAKHTEGPWDGERLFEDAFTHRGGHTTIDKDYITIFCGQEALDDIDYEKHPWIEVHGSNQEANADLVKAAPDLILALKDIESCVGWSDTLQRWEVAQRVGDALSGARQLIQRVDGTWRGCVESDADRVNREKKERINRAAPDLLAACKALEELVQDSGALADASVVGAVVREAQTAIAKAEGN